MKYSSSFPPLSPHQTVDSCCLQEIRSCSSTQERKSRQDLRTSRGLLNINCLRYGSGPRCVSGVSNFGKFSAREGFRKLIPNEPVQDVLSPLARVTGDAGVDLSFLPSDTNWFMVIHCCIPHTRYSTVCLLPGLVYIFMFQASECCSVPGTVSTFATGYVLHDR